MYRKIKKKVNRRERKLTYMSRKEEVIWKEREGKARDR